MRQNIQQRIRSIDFFRGMTIAAMLIVNNPGSWAHMYAPLRHAAWDGCTFADLIFPCFIFVMGITIAFTIKSKKKQEGNDKKILLKAARRALILFSLGLFLSLYPKIFTDPLAAFKTVRIPGVLQRIAIVFFVSTYFCLKYQPLSILKLFIGLLLIYWFVMIYVPVPGIGDANLAPMTNLGAWLDRTILTEAHLWKAAVKWDPEGILSTLPAIATGLWGVLIGILLQHKAWSHAKRVIFTILMGIFSISIGLFWGKFFPINKSLWTSSYVLYTGGIAAIIMGLSHWLIDIKGYQSFTKPFVVFGVNAITVFFVAGLLPRTLNFIKIKASIGSSLALPTYLYKQLFVPYLSPCNASLAWSVCWLLIWMSVLWIMYKYRIIVKI